MVVRLSLILRARKNDFAPQPSSTTSLQGALASEVSLSLSIVYQIFIYRLYYETPLLFINNKSLDGIPPFL